MAGSESSASELRAALVRLRSKVSASSSPRPGSGSSNRGTSLGREVEHWLLHRPQLSAPPRPPLSPSGGVELQAEAATLEGAEAASARWSPVRAPLFSPAPAHGKRVSLSLSPPLPSRSPATLRQQLGDIASGSARSPLPRRRPAAGRNPPPQAWPEDCPLLGLSADSAARLLTLAVPAGWTTARLTAVASHVLALGIGTLSLRHREALEQVMSADEVSAVSRMHPSGQQPVALFAFGHLMAAPALAAASVEPAGRSLCVVRAHGLSWSMPEGPSGRRRLAQPTLRPMAGKTVYGVRYALMPQALVHLASLLPGRRLMSVAGCDCRTFVKEDAIAFTAETAVGGLVPSPAYIQTMIAGGSDVLPPPYVEHLRALFAACCGPLPPTLKERHRKLALSVALDGAVG
eukprot:TRINITY_DN20075_c0_g1_i2.p1 TRINITY_DN20075_c0_g1~~TRINITY_DN20075_c0_g1_i2.p1  ORF type:complete len:404 (+),score=124.45 TRINITY_DN20075_c0_g1_i2:72-1283(+)